MVALKNDASAVLDTTYKALLEGKAHDAMQHLVPGLRQLRDSHSADEWDAFCRTEFLTHPVKELVWQDPFTRHAFEKPRGYPGDAHLLDYIYGDCPPPAGTTPLGLEIFQYTTNAPGPQSVRARRNLLAQIIDEVAGSFAGARILSIACGHLREAGLSKALAERRIGDFIALDQDAHSLDEVKRVYGDKGIRTICAPLRALVAERIRFQGIHLAYAAGLYDYLADRTATRLTRLMFDMLAPGGRLVVANFAPSLRDIGYMETYMGWKLIYREAEQMIALARDIASAEWKSHRLFWDEHEGIIFLEITRRKGINGSVTLGANLSEAGIPGLSNVTLGPEVASRRIHRHKSPAAGNGAAGKNGAGHH